VNADKKKRQMNRDATVCRKPSGTRTFFLLKSLFDGRRRNPKLGAALAGVGVTVFVLVIYLRTLAPTILPYDSPDLLDVAMLQMQVCVLQVCVLGMTHPTGYPSYLMLSHLFTYLPFGDCANLASATYAALAVLAVFAAGYVLSRRVAAAAAALAFGVGMTLWSEAVIAEVYTLNSLLTALTLLGALLQYIPKPEPAATGRG
jgi:Protein of unknown function (DUF2723)